jgi:erythromycin esterase
VAKADYYGSGGLLGMRLETGFGGGYYAVGTEFYNTDFIAVRLNGGNLTEHSFSDGTRALANAFADTGMDTAVLDTKKAVWAGGELAEILTSTQNMGTIGAAFGPGYSNEYWFSPSVPADAYDAIIFVRDATPAVSY